MGSYGEIASLEKAMESPSMEENIFLLL